MPRRTFQGDPLDVLTSLLAYLWTLNTDYIHVVVEHDDTETENVVEEESVANDNIESSSEILVGEEELRELLLDTDEDDYQFI